jgi:hypothetical protein
MVNCHGSRKFVKGHLRSVAVQAVSEPENCHDAGFILRAGARVRVQEPLPIYLGSRKQKQKCVPNNLPILSVLATGNITVSLALMLLIEKPLIPELKNQA